MLSITVSKAQFPFARFLTPGCKLIPWNLAFCIALSSIGATDSAIFSKDCANESTSELNCANFDYFCFIVPFLSAPPLSRTGIGLANFTGFLLWFLNLQSFVLGLGKWETKQFLHLSEHSVLLACINIYIKSRLNIFLPSCFTCSILELRSRNSSSSALACTYIQLYLNTCLILSVLPDVVC